MASVDHVPTDGELLMRFCRHQEESAFRLLLERHAPLVFGVCSRVLRHHQDVEDAFQATFLVLAQRATTVQRSSSLASWLYKVAQRTSLHARKRRVEEPIDEEPTAPDAALEDVQRRDQAAVLDEELARLPEQLRAPLVLCYLQGLSRSEAAEALECTDAAVKSRLARGRRALRLRLARRGVGFSLALAAVSQARIASASTELHNQVVSSCLDTAGGAVPSTVCDSSVGSLAQFGAHPMLLTSFLKPAGLCLAVLATLGVVAAQSADKQGQGPSLQANVESKGKNASAQSVTAAVRLAKAPQRVPTAVAARSNAERKAELIVLEGELEYRHHMVKVLDLRAKAKQIEIDALDHSNAAELLMKAKRYEKLADLEELLAEKKRAQSLVAATEQRHQALRDSLAAQTAPQPRPRNRKARIENDVQIEVVEGTDGIIIRGSKADVEKVAEALTEISENAKSDKAKPDKAQAHTEVYQLKHVGARDFALTVKALAHGWLADGLQVEAEEASNSVLIRGSKKQVETVRKLLGEIDAEAARLR